jgi:hypothetical protein
MLAMRNNADVTSGKLIAVLLQSISGAINPLVAFYDIHGIKREVIFFYLLLILVKRVCLGEISEKPLLPLRG